MTIKSQMTRSELATGLGNMNLGRSRLTRQLLIGAILILALLAFEMFNFDTTRYALQNLLGDVRFATLTWATILAVAFCAIDFAGLARLFTPERGLGESREIWFLTGAWLLGASMNAVMTWWAVSSVLVGHELGNEILSREQLLRIVPIFVAVLVWLTRILFIGAITIAGERILYGRDGSTSGSSANSASKSAGGRTQPDQVPAQVGARASARPVPAPVTASPSSGSGARTRVGRRPPRPVSRPNKVPRYQGTATGKGG